MYTIATTNTVNKPCFLTFLPDLTTKYTNAKVEKPIRTHYSGHVTGYQPIRDQYFLTRSDPRNLPSEYPPIRKEGSQGRVDGVERHGHIGYCDILYQNHRDIIQLYRIVLARGYQDEDVTKDVD
eukprot:sb/3475793/